MSSLVDKFVELEHLLRNDRETLALHAGVPFVLLIYDPEQERQCREEQAHLRTKLEDVGLTVREISVKTFVFDHYAKIGLLNEVFEKEQHAPETVYRDLAKHYRPALVKHIIAMAETLPATHTVIFLTEVAHLYPFVRVANLLEDLENRVKLPLVVFYPGEELDGELRFLGLENADGPHTKYRARRI
ncbi:MAG: DUF1788 domain-containing protein [Anaerolineae bacterium]|nr:DUF1788 domain-containing protein [Anaerolineae bacterium]